VKRSKRYKAGEELVDRNKYYSWEEAIDILKSMPPTKFNQTLEVSIKLGIDPRKSEQMVRGSAKLPAGLGKKKKILVFCEPEKEEEAKQAGADFVGSKELIEKISKGWLDFDYCIATPSMMREVSKLGRILGPRGLMPSPKSGTVTDNLTWAINEAKQGKLDYKMDKFGSLNVGVGKISFPKEKLLENLRAFFSSLIQAKPSSCKGKFIKSVSLSLSMSKGLRVSLPKEFDL